MMTAVSPRSARVAPLTSITTYYRMLMRGQLTRGRVIGLAALGGISILLAAVSRGADQPEEAAVNVLSRYSISLLIPLAALILATPMLGNLIEDRLLVYLWLKPVPRWHLALAAFAAVVTALIPVVVVPIAISALLSGFSSLVIPSIVAALFGVLAYSGIYLFMGARFSWGLWLGLLYLVLWENVVAMFGDGMARLSIRSYLVTILERGTNEEIDLANRSTWASLVIPLVIAAAGIALTAWSLHNRDVD